MNAESNAERDPCSRMYVGPAPFSEPETEAVARFLANHNDSIKAYLAYHSFSQLWMLPYSYSKEQNPPNLEQLVGYSSLFNQVDFSLTHSAGTSVIST